MFVFVACCGAIALLAAPISCAASAAASSHRPTSKLPPTATSKCRASATSGATPAASPKWTIADDRRFADAETRLCGSLSDSLNLCSGGEAPAGPPEPANDGEAA